jgi:hypothetical protein
LSIVSSCRAESSADSSMPSCAKSDPRSEPSALLSRMNRVPLWSNVRYAAPNSAFQASSVPWPLTEYASWLPGT